MAALTLLQKHIHQRDLAELVDRLAPILLAGVRIRAAFTRIEQHRYHQWQFFMPCLQVSLHGGYRIAYKALYAMR